MTVRVGEFATLPAVNDLAAQVGLGALPPNPSNYLGAFEATLKEVTTAYTAFPDAGKRRQSYIIREVIDRTGRSIYKATEASLAAISPPAVAVVDEILQTVVTSGTAAKSKSLGLTVPAAGKTGTTDDYKDAWFVGYTSSLTTGVWVGFDQPQRIMNRGYGSTLALPIWVDFVEEASKRDYFAGDLGIEIPRVRGPLCHRSGLQATGGVSGLGQCLHRRHPQGHDPHPLVRSPSRGTRRRAENRTPRRRRHSDPVSASRSGSRRRRGPGRAAGGVASSRARAFSASRRTRLPRPPNRRWLHF